MSDIKGLPTHDNLKAAFAGESGTVHRYLYFAKIADIEGYPDVAQLFRELAEGGLHNTHGNLDFLKQAGDPATDMPIGETDRNLAAAIIAETRELDEVYPEMAVKAREDGLTDVASWFETLGKVKRAHVSRLRQAVQQLQAMPGDDDEEHR
jgi:rubrerythrin